MSNIAPNVDDGGDSSAKHSIDNRSNIRLLALVASSVFLAEVFVMIALSFLPSLPTWWQAIIDATLLTILIFPILYFGLFRFLDRLILKHQHALKELGYHRERLEELVTDRTADLSAALKELKQEIADHKIAEDLLQERTADLDDRIREIQCLYRIAKFMEEPDRSWEELVQMTVDLIPFAWLNPGNLGVHVTLDGHEFTTKNFKKTGLKHVDYITVDGEQIGTITVCCLAGNTSSQDSIFLNQRHQLIANVAEQIGIMIQGRRTQSALRESERTYRRVAENLHEGIWFIDQDEVTTYVNPRMADMLGYTVDEMIGQRLFAFMDERGVALCKHNLQRRKQGIKEQHDFELLRKDGQRIYTSMESTPVTDTTGNYIGALASVADITERKAMEMELRQRTYELGERVKKLNCLYGISNLVDKPGISLPEILQGIVDLVPNSWQYPEITCAAITMEDQEYKTDNFRETKWVQQCKIRVHGELFGSLQVFYLENRPEMDEGPFLKEERKLIKTIAVNLGRIIEKTRVEKKLKRELTVNAALSNLYEPLIKPSASIENIAAAVLSKAQSLTNSRNGYVSSIDSRTGDVVIHATTEMLQNECRVSSGTSMSFYRGDDGNYHGLWGDSLNSLTAFYTNEPQQHPAAAGVPEGHIPIRRFLSVPVMLGEQLVGQIALANKSEDYSAQDLDAVGRVARFYALAIQRNRVEEELQKSKVHLEKRVQDRTAEIAIANQKLVGEIEDRKHAEKLLRQSKTMLQAVFDGISDPLILINRDMEIRMINETAAKYYKIADWQEAVGKICYQGVGSPTPCADCKIPTAVLEGESLTFERQGFTNPSRLEKVVIYPLKEKGYGVGDAVIHVIDITEAKRLEQQLIQSEKMASLGVLVSSIAHEINNPNNFVSFNVPILRDYIQEILPITDDYATTQSQFELCNMAYPEFRRDILKLLDNIEHGSSRINSFVSNLREYSQIKERRPLNWVDLEAIIEKVFAICRSKIEKSVRSFIKTIPEHLDKIYSNAQVLEQILINLLVNAARAADKKDSWIKLKVKVNRDWAEHIIIEVSDNGSGMNEEIQTKNI